MDHELLQFARNMIPDFESEAIAEPLEIDGVSGNEKEDDYTESGAFVQYPIMQEVSDGTPDRTKLREHDIALLSFQQHHFEAFMEHPVSESP